MVLRQFGKFKVELKFELGIFSPQRDSVLEFPICKIMDCTPVVVTDFLWFHSIVSFIYLFLYWKHFF